jgi:hypothetical protein
LEQLNPCIEDRVNMLTDAQGRAANGQTRSPNDAGELNTELRR